MEKSNNISFRINEICRLCLTHDGLMRSIFDSDVTEQPENCLPFRINSCISIKLSMSDRLPSKICHRCLFKVDMFFEFKVMCLNSENTLKERLDCSEDESEHLLESIDRSEKDLIGTFGSLDELEDPRDCEKTVGRIDEFDGVSNSALMKDRSVVAEAEPYLDSSEEISTGEAAEELKCEVSLMDIKGENSEGESNDSVQNQEDHHSMEDQGRPLELSEDSYSCQDCWKPFSRCSLLMNHRRSHDSEHSFACDLCPSTFGCSSQLTLHRISKHKHDDSRERSLKCPICGRVFSDSTSQSRHMRMHAGQHLFSCGLCPRAFHRHSMLMTHIAASHLEQQHQELEQQQGQHQEQQLVPMDVARRVGDPLDPCGRISPTPNGNTKRKRFTCQLCMKTFSDSYTLQRHGRTHTGERPYPCSICGKTFSRSWSLARHDLLHTGERPHCCPLCGKRFADRSHLLRHVRTHGRAAAAAESALRAK